MTENKSYLKKAASKFASVFRRKSHSDAQGSRYVAAFRNENNSMWLRRESRCIRNKLSFRKNNPTAPTASKDAAADKIRWKQYKLMQISPNLFIIDPHLMQMALNLKSSSQLVDILHGTESAKKGMNFVYDNVKVFDLGFNELILDKIKDMQPIVVSQQENIFKKQGFSNVCTFSKITSELPTTENILEVLGMLHEWLNSPHDMNQPMSQQSIPVAIIAASSFAHLLVLLACQSLSTTPKVKEDCVNSIIKDTGKFKELIYTKKKNKLEKFNTRLAKGHHHTNLLKVPDSIALSRLLCNVGELWEAYAAANHSIVLSRPLSLPTLNDVQQFQWKDVVLRKIMYSHSPRWNTKRTGSRPYFMILKGDGSQVIYSSMVQGIKKFPYENNQPICFDVNCILKGDIIIKSYHLSPGKAGKMMFQTRFHTATIEPKVELDLVNTYENNTQFVVVRVPMNQLEALPSDDKIIWEALDETFEIMMLFSVNVSNQTVEKDSHSYGVIHDAISSLPNESKTVISTSSVDNRSIAQVNDTTMEHVLSNEGVTSTSATRIDKSSKISNNRRIRLSRNTKTQGGPTPVPRIELNGPPPSCITAPLEIHEKNDTLVDQAEKPLMPLQLKCSSFRCAKIDYICNYERVQSSRVYGTSNNLDASSQQPTQWNFNSTRFSWRCPACGTITSKSKIRNFWFVEEDANDSFINSPEYKALEEMEESEDDEEVDDDPEFMARRIRENTFQQLLDYLSDTSDYDVHDRSVNLSPFEGNVFLERRASTGRVGGLSQDRLATQLEFLCSICPSVPRHLVEGHLQLAALGLRTESALQGAVEQLLFETLIPMEQAYAASNEHQPADVSTEDAGTIHLETRYGSAILSPMDGSNGPMFPDSTTLVQFPWGRGYLADGQWWEAPSSSTMNTDQQRSIGEITDVEDASYSQRLQDQFAAQVNTIESDAIFAQLLQQQLNMEDRDTIHRMQRHPTTRPSRSIGGSLQSEIEMLPLHVYKSNDNKHEGTASKCIICQFDYNEGDQIRTLPCFHSYHAECVDEWLLRKPQCPVCQQPIAG